MVLNTVESRMVHAVGYEPRTQELEVITVSGRIVRYAGVPAHIYSEFMASHSKGRYLCSHIDNHYPAYELSQRQQLLR